MRTKQLNIVSDWLRLLVTMAAVTSSVCFLGWKSYVEPRVDIKMESKIKPVEEKITGMESEMKTTSYMVNKSLLILERTTDKKLLRQIEKELENFKP